MAPPPLFVPEHGPGDRESLVNSRLEGRAVEGGAFDGSERPIGRQTPS